MTMSESNGNASDGRSGDGRSIPRTERPDAPAYLQRHQQRRAEQSLRAKSAEDDHQETPEQHVDRTGEVPLYLRRFRDRQATEPHGLEAPLPSFAGQDLGTSRAWAEVTRTKEIIPERR